MLQSTDYKKAVALMNLCISGLSCNQVTNHQGLYLHFAPRMSETSESEFLLAIDTFWRIKSDGVRGPVVDSNSIKRAQNPSESARIGALIGEEVRDVSVSSTKWWSAHKSA